MRDGWYNRRGKRQVDVLVSTTALALLVPLLILVALAVRFFLGKPVLFRQYRPGLHGEHFCLWKFRSMTNLDGLDQLAVPDAQRLTWFGRVLRRTSLDELPQLLNVLLGDMSLVGPRPLLPQYIRRYTSHQARRHEVKPGITGWAQINGRNALGWERRLDLDVWYVDHVSLELDMKILALTVIRTLLPDGISAPGEATVTEFQGSEQRHGTVTDDAKE